MILHPVSFFVLLFSTKSNLYISYKVMYGKMIKELTRLKSKYTAPEWDDVRPAQDLLTLLDDFILDITKDLING